ncbi:MAG: ATP synthase F1 subunit epsilon [Thermoleophilia bacterium]|nr:ATP synthase F1 subunit epsilon [Thermoleophilia bacterium]
MEETKTAIGFKCEIVTPEGLIYDGPCDMVIVPGEMGELGILPRHAPLVSRTIIGEARFKDPVGGWTLLAVGNGYVKMQFDRLLLLVDTAEDAADIDTDRARTALDRAEAYLARAHEDDVDLHRAEQSRHRAANRLKVAGKA